jgi:DNA-binding response OmpR family regulator
MLRLLLVEDSRDDADLIRFELEDAGMECELRQVWSRTMLQDALRDFVPTMAISDLTLPGYCGMEALRMLHECLPHVPLLLLTGQPLLVPQDLRATILDKAHLKCLPALIRAATSRP